MVEDKDCQDAYERGLCLQCVTGLDRNQVAAGVPDKVPDEQAFPGEDRDPSGKAEAAIPI